MVFIYFIVFIVLRPTPAYSTPNEYAASSSNPPNAQQIEHAHFLVNDISNLYLDEEFSDVVLRVENEQFHAHRAVLASRSTVFKKMLYGEHIEAREINVTLKEASATSFRVLLGYIYSGRMDLSILEGKYILELFRLSNFFCISNLQNALTDYLRSDISVDNVCSLLTEAQSCERKDLEDDLLNFIDMNVLDVLRSEDALSLSPETFQVILNRDTAYANDLDVFRAVCRWIEINQDVLDPDVKYDILSAVRYECMDDEELSEVRQSPLVCSDITILNVINSRALERNVNLVERNLKEPFRIDGGTMIELDRPSIINYIEMNLRVPYPWVHTPTAPYTYYIEVSTDENDWSRLIDHSSYHCRSVQRLWFHRRVVRYIRIIGTGNVSGRPFTFLNVMYNTDERDSVEIRNGFVAPKYNVASYDTGALLVDGLRSNHGGYMYHSIGASCIKVQLTQPYLLSSMRMRLWDGQGESFRYTVDVSVDDLIWENIVDKSNKWARSWQLLKFDARLIVYIRITGVRSSYRDSTFKCEQLEAPAQS